MGMFGKFFAPKENKDRLGQRLYDAATMGDVLTVREVLREKPNLKWTPPGDVTGRGALHVACEKGFMETVAALIGSGFPVDESDLHGNTPLIVAAQNSKPEIVEFLINHGAKVNNRNILQSTALHEAAYAGSKECIDILVKHKANLNLRDSTGKTPKEKAELAGNGYLFLKPLEDPTTSGS
jgi:ankyrin repeat protein